MQETRKISSVQRLAECAIMLALAIVLNEFTPFKLPFGGSVTFFAQLPIVVIGYRHGVKWGLLTGFAMGVIEMLFGLENFSYVTGIAAYLILIFADYIVAFGSLGLGGVFRSTIKNQALVYSLTYNGSYMLPELIMTVIGALILGSLLDFRAPRLRALKHGKTAE